MPPIISSGGFKGPAPVLPAMGLHSFHADSPPFAAGSSDMEPPEHLSLDEVVDVASERSNGYTGASASAPLQVLDHIDDQAARARSRRLVSGYRFGNPPSPVTTLRSPRPADGEEVLADVDTCDETAPSHDSDSPPLTDPDSTNEAAVEMRGLTLEGQSTPQGSSTRRYSERRRFDALAGLHDGEADEDRSAVKAPHGSEAYLRGERPYHFPKHRLRTTMKDESKIPLIIVACGSFSPPTYLHLRMFEMAKDEIVESQTYEIMAGYYSPVSSYYKKAGLAPAVDRVRMCELAVEHTSTWLMVDPWEAGQPEYQRTAVVLDHFDEMVNDGPDGPGGVQMSDGSKRRYKVMLLAGGDLIESFGEPGVWSEPDLHVILGRFGCLIVERAGSDVWAFLLSHDILYHNRRNVIVIKQLIYNDISSTKVRLFVRRGMSIKYLLPNSVIQYIHEHKLYREPDKKPEYRVDP